MFLIDYGSLHYLPDNFLMMLRTMLRVLRSMLRVLRTMLRVLRSMLRVLRSMLRVLRTMLRIRIQMMFRTLPSAVCARTCLRFTLTSGM